MIITLPGASLRSLDEEIVVLAEVQPVNSLYGYQTGMIQHSRVISVNGTSVVSMRQLAKQVHTEFETKFTVGYTFGCFTVYCSMPILYCYSSCISACMNNRPFSLQVLESQDEFLRLELEGDVVVVLSSSQAKSDTAFLIKQYQVKLPVSDELADLTPQQSAARHLRRGDKAA